MRQPGSNTIEVTDADPHAAAVVRATLPPSVHLTVRGDRSRNIREAFSDIQWTMVVTLVLVVAVIFAFLHNGSATLIPALALPFSILGTFAVMEMMDFTLDNLSMMALILSIGFVVDDAIVMLENIVRHVEKGENALDAALKGSQEIGFTILSMTASLAAVFIPILFMGGILGRLFREFAVTITAAILISGVVSVTLTPMLCSRFLNAAAIHAKGRFARLVERLFHAMFQLLRVEPRRRAPAPPGHAAGIRRGARRHLGMFVVVPKGFIPDEDNDTLNINLRAQQGTSYYEMLDNAKQVGAIINRNPNVDTFFASTGGNFGSMNTATVLRPVEAATRTPVVCRADRRAAASRAARGSRASRRSSALPPAIRIGGRQSNSSYILTVESADTANLYTWARKLEDADRHAAGSAGRVRRHGDEEPPRRSGRRSRRGRRRRPDRQRHRRRALQRARPAVGVDDLRRQGAVQGAARARSEGSGAGRLAEEDLVQGAERRARAARIGRQHQGDRRPADA